MSAGIYLYLDKQTNEIVYIGKDSNIHRNERHKAHLNPNNYSKQHINKVLQNNLDRYKYDIFCEGNFSNHELNCFEIELINIFNPLFNFTKGGEGVNGFKWNKKRKEKHSQIMKEFWEDDEYREETCKKIKEAVNKSEYKEKMSKRMLGNKHAQGPHNVSENTYNQMLKNLEKGRLSNDYATIEKQGFNSSRKQIYCIRFKGKRLKRSIDKNKLLNWFLKEYPLEKIKMEV